MTYKCVVCGGEKAENDRIFMCEQCWQSHDKWPVTGIGTAIKWAAKRARKIDRERRQAADDSRAQPKEI